jgi:hypothetical protein
MRNFHVGGYCMMDQGHREEQSQKKSYSSPQLIEYGDVRKLTETGGTSLGDAGILKRPKA